MIRRLVLVSLLAVPVLVQAKPPQKVIVATETWGELMYLDANNKPAGPLADFVHRMNQVQNKFAFEISIYPRTRLDRIYAQRKGDVYPLRSMTWVSPAMNLLPTKTILTSGDVYIARKNNHYGGDAVFDKPRSKIVAGVRGYHYHHFNNIAEEAYIKRNYKADLLNSNEAVIQFVLADRADLGIVPEMIVAKYLKDQGNNGQLIVGPFDSRVELSNLVRAGGPVSVSQMNAIIDMLVKSGDVARLRDTLTIARPALKQ